MSHLYIDIHTHSIRPGITSVLSYSVGRDSGPIPASPYVSAGIHPWDAGSMELSPALSFLESAPLAAIGEIGLDFAKEGERARQQEVLSAQLDIAQRRGLPVIIHCVKTYNEVLAALKNRSLKAVIFHGYIGSPEQTGRILGNGYYFSVGEKSLGSPKTVASLENAPLDHIFAETDTADTTIEDIYEKIAGIKRIDVQTLRGAISKNFKMIFG